VKYYHLTVGAQGQVKWARGPKSSLLMMSLTKNMQPQPKNFFRVQTRRLAVSFDASTRSVALTEQEKFPRKAMCVSVFFFQKSPKAAGRQSVNEV